MAARRPGPGPAPAPARPPRAWAARGDSSARGGVAEGPRRWRALRPLASGQGRAASEIYGIPLRTACYPGVPVSSPVTNEFSLGTSNNGGSL